MSDGVGPLRRTLGKLLLAGAQKVSNSVRRRCPSRSTGENRGFFLRHRLFGRGEIAWRQSGSRAVDEWIVHKLERLHELHHFFARSNSDDTREIKREAFDGRIKKLDYSRALRPLYANRKTRPFLRTFMSEKEQRTLFQRTLLRFTDFNSKNCIHFHMCMTDTRQQNGLCLWSMRLSSVFSYEKDKICAISIKIASSGSRNNANFLLIITIGGQLSFVTFSTNIISEELAGAKFC